MADIVIRVNEPYDLLKDSYSLKSIASSLERAASAVRDAANSAPSYNGQFGPKVRAIGFEAQMSGVRKSEAIQENGKKLDKHAERFQAADNGWGFSQIERLMARQSGWPTWFLDQMHEWMFQIKDINDPRLLLASSSKLGAASLKNLKVKNILSTLYEKITKYKNIYDKVKEYKKNPISAIKDGLKAGNEWLAEKSQNWGGIWPTLNELQHQYYEPGKKIYDAGKHLFMGATFLSRLAPKTIDYIRANGTHVTYDTIIVKGNDWISKGMKKLFGVKDATRHIGGATLLASAWVEGMVDAIGDGIDRAKDSFKKEVGSHSRKVAAGGADGMFQFGMEAAVVTGTTFGVAAGVAFLTTGAVTLGAMTAFAPVTIALGTFVVLHQVIGKDLGVYDKITDWWKTTKTREALVSAGEKVVDTVKDVGKAAVNVAKDIYEDAKDWAKDTKEKVDQALETGQNAFKSVVGGFKKLFA